MDNLPEAPESLQREFAKAQVFADHIVSVAAADPSLTHAQLTGLTGATLMIAGAPRGELASLTACLLTAALSHCALELAKLRATKDQQSTTA